MMKEQLRRVLVVITALWVTAILALRVQMFALHLGVPLPTAAGYYLPEIVVAVLFVMVLPAVWMRRSWTSAALVGFAVLLLVLLLNSAFTELWLVTFSSLLVLAYANWLVVPASVMAPAGAVLWPSLALSMTGMYAGTPSAYLQLSSGAAGAIDGFRQGHWLLASALLVCSLLGLYGLWTVWSISTRAWRHGRYVVRSSRGRLRDGIGLLAGWMACAGLFAIASSIFREEEIVLFGVLLLPSLVVTTVLVAVVPPQGVDDAVRIPLSGLVRRLQGRHVLGMAAGVAVAILGAAFLLPSTPSGWGRCEWTVMFPIGADLWPIERGMIFDACDTGLFYQTILLAVASFVSWMSGLLTVVIGKSRDAWQGAIAAAVGASAVLAWTIAARVIDVLALPLKPLPPLSLYIHPVSTMCVGLALVLWCGRLGYLGGRAAGRDESRVALPESA